VKVELAASFAGMVAEELVLEPASRLGETDIERTAVLAEAIEWKFGIGTSGPLAVQLVPQPGIRPRQYASKSSGRRACPGSI
jgi:hypothetical protein